LAKDEKQAALDAALKKIEKNFGKGAVMRMGEKVDTQISTVPTGSLALDAAIGVGGYPRGRIVEVYGPESSGKTTICSSSSTFLNFCNCMQGHSCLTR